MTFTLSKTIQGTPVSPGIGYGRPCFSNVQVSELSDIANHNSNNITRRIANTFAKLSNDLQRLASDAEKRIDKNTAEIFYAHRLILEDTSLQDRILNSVTGNIKSAEEAIESCFDAYYSYFNQLNDGYTGNRAEIFSELKQLLLNLLHNTDITLFCRESEGCSIGECTLGNDHILIIKELNAYAMARLGEKTKGIVAEICGKNSHAAIIARALGVPVVSGITNIEKDISSSSDLFINGETGLITIDPDDATLALLKEQFNSYQNALEISEPVTNFTVLADINCWKDVQDAIKVNAEGIGLYRTEIDALKAGRFLSEEEQFSYYKKLLKSMKGKPVYIRLFDLGADKSTDWLGLEDEENPALGCRGARYLLTHPDVVKNQARAIARASKQNHIKVVYPMIVGVEQFIQLKTLFMSYIKDIKHSHISHGIMFEVPAACIEAETLYKEIDFGRIGSNDLAQYLFAYDRTRDDFDLEKMLENPAIWTVIRDLIRVANKAGKPLEVCGEMTNNPVFIPELIKLGVTTISTNPHNIAKVRKAAEHISTKSP